MSRDRVASAIRGIVAAWKDQLDFYCQGRNGRITAITFAAAVCCLVAALIFSRWMVVLALPVMVLGATSFKEE